MACSLKCFILNKCAFQKKKVSAESDAATVPPIALVSKFLRSPPPHGRRPARAAPHARPGGRGQGNVGWRGYI